MTVTRLSGWHVLLIAFVFFGTIIGMNVVMITYAISTFSGDDEHDAFDPGPRNSGAASGEVLTDLRAAGIAVKIEGTRDASGAVHLVVTASHDDVAQGDLTMTGVLRHPANSTLDRPVQFSFDGAVYRADLKDVAAGQWLLVVAGRRGDTVVVETRERLWLH